MPRFKSRKIRRTARKARSYRTSARARHSSRSSIKKTPIITFKSPYASAFKSAVKSGTPCGTVIQTIAKRTGKPASSIIKSLYKAGLCFCQKFNGTLICWPTFPCKKPAKASTCQTELWQCFIDYCCISGICKPTQLTSKIGSQKGFMIGCKNYFGKQVSSIGAAKSTSKRRKTKSSRRTKVRTLWNRSRKLRTARKAHSAKHARKSTSSRWSSSSWRTSYAFPTYRSRSATRRFVRAA